MIVIIALIVAVIVTIALTFGKFARSDSWRATVTPLASMGQQIGFVAIGLVCLVAAAVGAPAEG